MTALEIVYSELQEAPATGSGFLVRRVRTLAPCGLLVALEKPSDRRVLIIEVAAEAILPSTRFPSCRGFKVELIPVKPGPHGEVQIHLKAVAPGGEEIFTKLAQDVFDRIASKTTQQECVEAVVFRLSQWQRFFQRSGPEGLSPEAQQGLYSELWFLGERVIAVLPAVLAVRAWTGPLAANNDFQCPGGSIEVKSTAANPAARITISNVRQLDDTGLPALFLYLLLLEGHPGSETLPERVNAVRAALASSEVARAIFEDRLLEYGYLDSHQGLYEGGGYRVMGEHLFQVSEGFPRIIERELPAGVGSVSYAIDVSACLPFAVPLGNLMSLVEE